MHDLERTSAPPTDPSDTDLLDYEQQVLADVEQRKDIEDTLEDKETPFTYSISSYGADYDVRGLVQRIRDEDIIVPEFQRKYVWTQARASRFIESLLLGLPVPGIFLAIDPKTRQLLVIDGQQRLRSLRHFYDGMFPKGEGTVPFILKGERNKPLNPEFEGKAYADLEPRDRRDLDNAIIHATVIKQDKPEEEDSSSIYYIFERLNTGGVSLQPQEIRASIYQGKLLRLLQDLNTYTNWRSIFGPVNQRMKDQELILRFFALYYNLEQYEKPLLTFLNKYMRDNRELEKQSETELVRVFTNTIDTVHRCLGERPFRPKRAINAPVYDAVMYGIAKRLERGSITDCEQLQVAYDMLIKDTEFVRLYTAGTTDPANVRDRLRLAAAAFAGVA